MGPKVVVLPLELGAWGKGYTQLLQRKFGAFWEKNCGYILLVQVTGKASFTAFQIYHAVVIFVYQLVGLGSLGTMQYRTQKHLRHRLCMNLIQRVVVKWP